MILVIFSPPGIRKKWTFYIVETESCITEELENLRNHLAWIVTTFPNNMNMNDLFSSQEEWKRIFNGCNVSIILKHINIKLWSSRKNDNM